MTLHKHELNEYGLYDIYTLWHQPWWQRTEYIIAFYTVIGMCALIILIKLIQWYIKHKKQIALSPWDHALLSIKKIAPTKIAEEHEKSFDSLFYVEMSKILKQYMHDRYAYAVKNSTDLETITYLKTINFDKELTEMISEILHGGEYVKFAGQKTVAENRERHFNMGIAIIKKTIPSASK